MAQDDSLVAYIAFILIILCPICVFIVFFYAEPDFPWHTYITAILGFYAAFGIMLMIPIDIAVVVTDRTSTATGHDAGYDYDVDTLAAVYNTFFTIVLILGSVVLVFEEYFNTDGYFTLRGKLWSSFKRMCFDLAIPGVVGLIVLGILLGQKVVASNADALKLAAILVTNTMYELFLMFLLGYALVEFPRSIWGMSNLDGYLLKTQTKAAQQYKDISDAQLNVSLCVSDVLKTKTALTSYRDPELTAAMDILIADCPPEFRSDRQGKVIGDKNGKITIDSLAKLRTRLNVLKDAYKMAQAKVEGTKLLAYTLEDMVQAKNNPASGGQVIHWSLTDKDSTPWEATWHLRIKPICLKLLAVICGLLSLFSFLGVVCSMAGVSNGVSPYYLATHQDEPRTANICVFIFLTFGYTVYITTWAIFEIKLGAAYELTPGRTTPEALSFNVRMVARLAAPLAFFYLGWIAENGIKTGSWTSNDGPDVTSLERIPVFNATTGNTTYVYQNVTTSEAIFMPSAFSKFYQLQNVSSVQQVFGTIFPIILYIVLGLFALNIFNRLLVFLKLDNYQFGAQIITDEQLREGKRQLQRHKPAAIRRFRRGELKTLISTLTGKGGGDEKKSCFTSILEVFTRKGTPLRDTVSSNSGLNDNNSGAVAEPPPSIHEPAGLSGLLEKKEERERFSLASNTWKEVYGEVRSPGFLHFYKDKKSADLNRFNDPSKGSDLVTVVDLKSITDFIIPEKKSKESLELDLILADEKLRLKFKTLGELDRWRRGLMDWKDFSYDIGMGGSKAPVKSTFTAKPSPGLSSSSSHHDDKPRMLEGWLEKKGGGKGFGSDWQKRFLRIDEVSGLLVYSKSSDPKEKPAGTIDLKFVNEISPYEKNGRPDPSRFNIDVGDKVYKFRATSEAEGKQWIDGLHAWKDYFLMNMT